MISDLRDHRLAELLDDAVIGLDPEPDERLAHVRRHGTARRAVRWGAAATATALFVGALTWAGLALRSDRVDVPLTPSEWETYRHDRVGWALRYPDGWRVQPFDDLEIGALVTNIGHDLRHPDLGPSHSTSAWDMTDLPTDAVVVQVSFGYEGPFHPVADPTTPFPLSLTDALEVFDDPEVRYGAPQPRLVIPLVIDGNNQHAVNVWFGPEATALDREVAELIVASLRFDAAEGSPEPEPTTPQPIVSPAKIEPFDDFGWAFDNSAGWFADSYRASCRVTNWSVFISNVAHDFSPLVPPGQPCFTRFNFDGLPSDVVIIELGTTAGGPSPAPVDHPDTVFPVSLEDARTDGRLFPIETHIIPVWRDGVASHSITVYFGQDASEEDRATVDRILESISLGARAQVG